MNNYFSDNVKRAIYIIVTIATYLILSFFLELTSKTRGIDFISLFVIPYIPYLILGCYFAAIVLFKALDMGRYGYLAYLVTIVGLIFINILVYVWSPEALLALITPLSYGIGILSVFLTFNIIMLIYSVIKFLHRK